MPDEGSKLLMAELLLQEKELRAKIGAIDAQLEEPLARLARARAILVKAKAAYEQILGEVKPLQSDRILLEGELQLVAEKKTEARMEARRIEARGVRPGTQQFVEQMNQLAGDPEEAKLHKATAALDLEAELAALKSQMGE